MLGLLQNYLSIKIVCYQFKGRRDDDTMALWGMSCDVYGQYLMTQGFHEKARDQFKKAYDISCDVNGDTDEQSLVLLNSLGRYKTLMIASFSNKLKV